MDSELVYRLEVLQLYLKFAEKQIDRAIENRWLSELEMGHLNELFLIVDNMRDRVNSERNRLSQENSERLNKILKNDLHN